MSDEDLSGMAAKLRAAGYRVFLPGEEIPVTDMLDMWVEIFSKLDRVAIDEELERLENRRGVLTQVRRFTKSKHRRRPARRRRSVDPEGDEDEDDEDDELDRLVESL